MMRIISFLILSITLSIVWSQNEPNTNGVHSKNKPYTVFNNAVIHIDGNVMIDGGTLIIQEDQIIYAGNKKKAPENSIIYDLDGRHIYPSFIELNSSFGIAETKRGPRDNWPQYDSKKKGPYYWNQAIKTEESAITSFSYNSEDAKKLRKLGFGAVLSQIDDGIARGSGTIIALVDDEKKQILNEEASLHFSFSKGSSRQVYPSSLMGSIALLRQYYIDLAYYETNTKHELNLTLEAGVKKKNLPRFFKVRDKQSILRASKIANEFEFNQTYLGNGDEYQILNDLTEEFSNHLVIPINYPKPYDVEDPFDAMYVTLSELKHWELAPSNPAMLEAKGLNFAISSEGLSKPDEFLKNLRLSVKRGLSKGTAINALTRTPAEILGRDDLGTLHQGKKANLLITSDDILNEDAIILENWVDGTKYQINEWDIVDIRGTYNLNVNQIIRTLEVSGSIEKPKGKLTYDIVADSVSESGDLVLDQVTGKPIKVTKEKTVKVNLTAEADYINLSYSLTEGTYRLSGNINFDSGSWDGKGQIPSGDWIEWTAIRKDKIKKKSEEEKTVEIDSLGIGKFAYPMVAYGWDSLPQTQAILIKNATVWTLEKEGKIHSDVLIRDGKIASIAKILDVVDPNTIVLDGTDMHLTPGIIDEHSHIAISRGVNEGSHAVTAEVRIGDVINNEDINIYRQLAGGVTAAQLLHGSANPVGGQSALIKLRWGATPEEMKIKDADGYIKFALGENVKQSNWGSYNTIRFPQTRMGVEQVYYDAFIRAKEYEKEWKAYNELSPKQINKTGAIPPKRDLQLETLLEIVNKKRFITCHSYVQSEINMLMHVADSMGFQVNTFTHILEGYKLADKMKEHGVGGSTFSDWWAYKYEVKDAIPYNASLLNQMGVTTAINSDDAEMGRRLNQEAAKGIKYGGMSEEEALKMVTLNPAKLLHLDDRMGSIKVGKDADLVLWSDHPLSIYAKVQNTIVDGIIYFDAERDQQLNQEVTKERSRIINKMIDAKHNGSETQKVIAKKKKGHICTSLEGDDY